MRIDRFCQAASLLFCVSCYPAGVKCVSSDPSCSPALFLIRNALFANTMPLAPISLTASRVYGQGGSFTTGGANNPALNADSLNRPFRPFLVSGGLYVADQSNARVLFFAGTSTTATGVYGTAGSFTAAGNTGTTSTTFKSLPSANVPDVWADSNGIYVTDIWASRIMFFPGTSTTATRFYGQFDNPAYDASNNDGSNNPGTPTAQTLANAEAVATDASGVYIADTFNHRILFYPGTSLTATRVYGQGGSFTNGNPNQGGRSADSLHEPRGIWVDADGLYVAEVQNHRVLFYPGTSTTATRVYGQNGDFATAASGASATGLNSPWFVTTFGGKVYIADTLNNRILEFEGTSTTATRVWGQGGSFTTSAANPSGITADSLSQPNGIALDATGMYVADWGNHRVLFYPR